MLYQESFLCPFENSSLPDAGSMPQAIVRVLFIGLTVWRPVATKRCLCTCVETVCPRSFLEYREPSLQIGVSPPRLGRVALSSQDTRLG